MGHLMAHLITQQHDVHSIPDVFESFQCSCFMEFSHKLHCVGVCCRGSSILGGDSITAEVVSTRT